MGRRQVGRWSAKRLTVSTLTISGICLDVSFFTYQIAYLAFTTKMWLFGMAQMGLSLYAAYASLYLLADFLKTSRSHRPSRTDSAT